MLMFRRIRKSFTNQLTLWVSVFVVGIIVVVLFLLARFSQGVILDESVETTLQVLENTALRIDNTLRLMEIKARMDKQTQKVDRATIERLIEENGILMKLRQTLPNVKLDAKESSAILQAVVAATEKGGYTEIEINGEESYVFYYPLQGGTYGLVAECPAEDFYGRFTRMQWFLLLSGVIGVLLLLAILYVVVGLHLLPLHRLADCAQNIADGDLDTPIPETRFIDESGRLQTSLSRMQCSLKAYMDEMQQKQTELSEHHAELQTAYSEAQALEERKAQFMYNMTEQMAAPVNVLCKSTDSICRNYSRLTKAEMARRQMDIMQASDTITRLLDQLIISTAL